MKTFPLAAYGIACLVVAGWFAVPGAAAAETLPGNRHQHPLLTIGASVDNYPYSFVGPSGPLQGFAVDLLDAVARVMQLQVRRETGSGPELATRFARGEFDALQVLSQSPDRESTTDFTVPYLTLQSCLFVRDDRGVKKLGDLAGERIAIVGAHSVGERFLAERRLGTVTVMAASPEDALRKVQDGDCAATFMSQLTAVSVIEHAHLHHLILLGGPNIDYDTRQCFAVHRGDAELLAQLNEGLAIIHRTGEFDQIYRKWFGRIDAPRLSRRQVAAYTVAILALAFGAGLWAYLRQRGLLHKLKRQAAELAGQRALLQALYDHIPTSMALIAIEPEGAKLISLNREAGRLYGIEPGAAANQPIAQLTLADGPRLHLEEVLRRRPKGNWIIPYEDHWAKDRRVLEVTIVPLTHDAGGPPRLCVLAQDITSRKQLDAEIAQSRKLRAVGELVGGIAHEFNNLLTPIMLKVGEIQLDWSYDTKLQGEVDVITKAAQRAAELTQRLLTFGRKTEIQSQAVRIDSVVGGCIDLLRHTVDRRIVWETAVPTGLPPLHFNGTDLNQILINLLLNARDTLLEKLSRPHDPAWTPKIQVAVTLLPDDDSDRGKIVPGGISQGWQRLTVRDNGLGMAPDVLERVFEPFFTTKEVGKGTGLGLATVWHLVTHGGGRVEIESTPGVGSTFHIVLPVWTTAAPAPAERAAPGIATTHSANVLLVEDEPLVARTVETVLRRRGHRVFTIADGAQAWRHLATRLAEYTLLVIDVNLPGMNGIDLVGLVRAQPFSGRILVMSGRLPLPEPGALAKFHVDQVLAKPFTVEQFDRAVDECLARDQRAAQPTAAS
jgi:two-component system cell cycle sensor histidine kinase/response regulator CckA